MQVFQHKRHIHTVPDVTDDDANGDLHDAASAGVFPHAPAPQLVVPQLTAPPTPEHRHALSETAIADAIAATGAASAGTNAAPTTSGRHVRSASADGRETGMRSSGSDEFGTSAAPAPKVAYDSAGGGLMGSDDAKATRSAAYGRTRSQSSSHIGLTYGPVHTGMDGSEPFGAMSAMGRAFPAYVATSARVCVCALVCVCVCPARGLERLLCGKQ